MSKALFKKIMVQNGVKVIPIYKAVLDKDGIEHRVSPNDKQEGTMHYYAEPKKYNWALYFVKSK